MRGRPPVQPLVDAACLEDPAAVGDDAAAAARAAASSFLSEVEAGHGGKTVELVEALRAARVGALLESVPCGLSAADLAAVKAALDREGTAVGRNRFLRVWAGEKRDRLLASWAVLSLPSSGSLSGPLRGGGGGGGGAKVARNTSALVRAGLEAANSSRINVRSVGRSAGVAGVAVFDFDQTLTTRHVGVFDDLSKVVDRIFGGAVRVGMLRALLEHLSRRSVVIAVVTRNSKHVVAKALRQVGFLGPIAGELVFGFEDYSDDLPKSTVVLRRILQPLGLPEARLLFVDDDRGNVEDVRNACPGASVVHCQRIGLTDAERDAIVAWADALC